MINNFNFFNLVIFCCIIISYYYVLKNNNVEKFNQEINYPYINRLRNLLNSHFKVIDRSCDITHQNKTACNRDNNCVYNDRMRKCENILFNKYRIDDSFITALKTYTDNVSNKYSNQLNKIKILENNYIKNKCFDFFYRIYDKDAANVDNKKKRMDAKWFNNKSDFDNCLISS